MREEKGEKRGMIGAVAIAVMIIIIAIIIVMS